jgi:16S rRNA U516 pseudouridylate synthase RsuA-like enzyme
MAALGAGNWRVNRDLLEDRATRFLDTLSPALIEALTGNPDARLVAAVAAAAMVEERSVWRAAAKRRQCPSYFHFMFNKPAGLTCQPSQFNRKNEDCVHDALPPGFPCVPFAGRLDADTEGLLLFSDDGRLLQQLVEPTHLRQQRSGETIQQSRSAPNEGNDDEKPERFDGKASLFEGHSKTYHVEVEFCVPDFVYIKTIGIMNGCGGGIYERREAAVETMRLPIEIYGKNTQPATVELFLPSNSNENCSTYPIFWVSVTIHEGKNHQVRRLCRRAGVRVLRLVRVSFGPLALGDIQLGTARALTDAEVNACYTAAGMPLSLSLPCPTPKTGAEFIPLLAAGAMTTQRSSVADFRKMALQSDSGDGNDRCQGSDRGSAGRRRRDLLTQR